jgi:pyridoxal phosphate enzyme (YggS family)
MPFSGLPERLAEVRDRIAAAVGRGGHGQQVEVVAVTKTHGPDAVEAVWRAGVRSVGENRVQEALVKMDAVTVPVAWHLIGHLQRNKAKYAKRFTLVHSVDSPRLADAISEVGAAGGSPIRVLVQVNTSGEASKGGYELSGLEAEAARLAMLSGLRVEGVMTMAPLDAVESVLRETFAGARQARDLLAGGGGAAAAVSLGICRA